MEDEKIKDNRFIDAKEQTDERMFDLTLRPQSLAEYIGQEKVKRNISISMQAAQERGEVVEHILLHGSPGLGKTTLAHIISKEMNSNIRVTTGPAIERAGDLAAILTNLADGDILFIDEIHRLNKTIEEILYPAMEEYALDIIVGKGPSARTLRLELPKFTIIGATTKMSLLSSPLRDRFGMVYRLDFYEPKDIYQILKRSSKILNISLEDKAAEVIASRARRTPRIANRLLKRVRDYVQVKDGGAITKELALKALNNLEVDEYGLDEVDRKILELIIERFNGGPVGLNTIAAAISEEMATIEDVYEPFLIQGGFLERTPRGRKATDLAYKHLNFKDEDKLL